ncbi:protein angel homolog 1 isoform X1 [Thunnus maccoyii]|uniref:protein angel homolog 1 isoform X1 n=1 Tax=Thunnus maccoyii TaxID=8240 RepID=UPI001C4BA4E2|nr:protein angel homolog 1 isoform X1 [Thunnus maccoyii]
MAVSVGLHLLLSGRPPRDVRTSPCVNVLLCSSNASKKGLPPAVVNGTAVWDAGAVTSRRFTQSQTTPLGQQLGPSSGSKGETKERMKEQSPVKQDDTRPDTDKEQLMAVLQGETKNEAKMSQVQSAVKLEETEIQEAQRQDKVETLKKEDTEIDHDRFYNKQNTEDGTNVASEDISPELALGAQLESLQTEDSIQATTCPVQEKTEIQSTEESVTPAEESVQYITYPVTPAEESVQYITYPVTSVEESVQYTTYPVTPAEESVQYTTYPVSPTVDSVQYITYPVTPVVESVQYATYPVTPAEESVQYTIYPVEEQIQIQSLEESVTPAEPSVQETTPLVQEQIQIPGAEEFVPEAETVVKVTECWDEYLADNDGAPSSDLVFTSLLANTENLTFSGQHDTQTGWHFPAGPGLADEVQCPLWQFPAVSYYPPAELTMPFEVMWRVWEEMDESATEARPALIPFPSTKASMDFTVMSYNILAQDLLEANQDLYTHCPLEVLDWSYRCSLLLKEIERWAPDILCLQEVQENHYHEQLYPVLTQMGYTCVYKRRTGTKTDGCATCYRSSLFSEVSVIPLEFFRPDVELLNRHNVGIVLLLRPVVPQGSQVKVTGPLLCVANTHLLFNPRRGDVKLAQLAMMLAEVHRVVKSCKAKGEHCNVILCGDFNSVPHMPLYQFITTGELYYQGLPAWMISGQEDLSYKANCHRLFAPLWPSCLGISDNCQYTTVEEMNESQSQVLGTRQYSHDFMLWLRYCPDAYVRPPDLQQIPGVTDNTPDASMRNQPFVRRFGHTISHRLDLESVYKHTLPGSGNSEVTTLHSEVGATVDYIFYSPKRISPSDQRAGGDLVNKGLKLISCLSLLSEDVLWSMKGLPNHIFPSDHLSLLAKFQLDLNAA